MSTNNVVTPIPPEIRSRAELLMSAARLLRVGVAAYGEHDEPWGGCEFEDVLEIVRLAKERVEAWLGAATEVRGPNVFDALDVLAVAGTVLSSGLNPSTNGITISPIRGLMKVAADTLEFAVDDETAELVGPGDGSEHQEDESAKAA